MLIETVFSMLTLGNRFKMITRWRANYMLARLAFTAFKSAGLGERFPTQKRFHSLIHRFIQDLEN